MYILVFFSHDHEKKKSSGRVLSNLSFVPSGGVNSALHSPVGPGRCCKGTEVAGHFHPKHMLPQREGGYLELLT